MKLATFTHPETGSRPRLGVVRDDLLVDPRATRAAALLRSGADPRDAAVRAAAEVPGDMLAFFAADTEGADQVRAALDEYHRLAGDAPVAGADGESAALDAAQVRLLAPVPRPRRIRDYLTYEEHAAGAGLRVPPAFAQMPICYKCNVETVIGPDETILWPSYTDQLDYELEVGFYVSREARNLSVAEAASALHPVATSLRRAAAAGDPAQCGGDLAPGITGRARRRNGAVASGT